MSERRPSRVIGAIAVLLLVAGVGVAVWQWRASMRSPASLPAPAAPAGEPRGDRAIEEALSQASPDSAEIKRRWVEVVNGLGVDSQPAAKREIFLRYANAESCTCGCGYTLAGCRASDMSCDISGGRLAALMDSVRAGTISTARGLRERPRIAR